MADVSLPRPERKRTGWPVFAAFAKADNGDGEQSELTGEGNPDFAFVKATR
jgi:hypothetical protein